MNNQDHNEAEGTTVELDFDEGAPPLLSETTPVGRILTDKIINRSVVKDMLEKAWGRPSGLLITDLGPNLYLFQLPNKEEAMRVLKGAPWLVLGQLLSIQPWTPEKSINEVNFDLVPFWVQLHDVQLEAMNANNAARIAATAGLIEEVENPFVNSQLLRSFLRVRVLVNTKAPLTSGVWVPRKNQPKS